MKNLIERVERLWCQHMHAPTMWPIHGRYRCGECLRDYPVPFALAAEQGLGALRASRPLRVEPEPARVL